MRYHPRSEPPLVSAERFHGSGLLRVVRLMCFNARTGKVEEVVPNRLSDGMFKQVGIRAGGGYHVVLMGLFMSHTGMRQTKVNPERITDSH